MLNKLLMTTIAERTDILAATGTESTKLVERERFLSKVL